MNVTKQDLERIAGKPLNFSLKDNSLILATSMVDTSLGDKEQEVDSVRGSFMLVRRELIQKLGWGFDPRYFFWFEGIRFLFIGGRKRFFL